MESVLLAIALLLSALGTYICFCSKLVEAIKSNMFL